MFVVYSEDQANVYSVNSQETFVVYSEDQVNVYLVNSQQTLPVYSEDTVDNYSINSTSVQDSVVDISFLSRIHEKETVLSLITLPST